MLPEPFDYLRIQTCDHAICSIESMTINASLVEDKQSITINASFCTINASFWIRAESINLLRVDGLSERPLNGFDILPRYRVGSLTSNGFVLDCIFQLGVPC